MATTQILIAGFGGQGVLFTGKCIAYKGLTEGKQLSWLPSYGPEMRGGTANCSVIISDTPVGSPIVSTPDVLTAMNLPSLDKYEDATVSGGKIFVDSTLIDRKVKRTDVDAYYIPATKLANDAGFPTLANMIMMGKMIKEAGFVSMDGMKEALGHVISAKRADMLEINLKAFTTDVYLMSTNALTLNGELYNVDGNSNRVAALLYGPKSVIIVCGVNKIVENLDEAVLRVKKCAAPKNTVRLHTGSYCENEGGCVSLNKDNAFMCDGCKGKGRICCNYVVSAQQRHVDRIKVILVDESLGY